MVKLTQPETKSYGLVYGITSSQVSEEICSQIDKSYVGNIPETQKTLYTADWSANVDQAEFLGAKLKTMRIKNALPMRRL